MELGNDYRKQILDFITNNYRNELAKELNINSDNIIIIDNYTPENTIKKFFTEQGSDDQNVNFNNELINIIKEFTIHHINTIFQNNLEKKQGVTYTYSDDINIVLKAITDFVNYMVKLSEPNSVGLLEKQNILDILKYYIKIIKALISKHISIKTNEKRQRNTMTNDKAVIIENKYKINNNSLKKRNKYRTKYNDIQNINLNIEITPINNTQLGINIIPNEMPVDYDELLLIPSYLDNYTTDNYKYIDNIVKNINNSVNKINNNNNNNNLDNSNLDNIISVLINIFNIELHTIIMTENQNRPNVNFEELVKLTPPLVPKEQEYYKLYLPVKHYDDINKFFIIKKQSSNTEKINNIIKDNFIKLITNINNSIKNIGLFNLYQIQARGIPDMQSYINYIYIQCYNIYKTIIFPNLEKIVTDVLNEIIELDTADTTEINNIMTGTLNNLYSLISGTTQVGEEQGAQGEAQGEGDQVAQGDQGERDQVGENKYRINNNNIYKNKYLKYKQKYLELKNNLV